MAAAQVQPKESHGPVVDPAITAVVGDVARPRGIVGFNHDLAHLPGESGWVAGLQTIAGMLRRGEDHISSLAARHGPVFRHMLGLEPAVFVGDPDLVWTVARNEDRAWSAALAWQHYFGGIFRDSETSDGLLTLDFDLHRDARRLIQPAFSAPAVAGYVESAQPLFEAAIADWTRRGRVRFKPEIRRLFARVSAKVFMGIDDPREAEMLDRAMNQGWQAVLAIRKRSRWGFGWRTAQRGYDTLWSSIAPHLETRREGGKDLLSRLCQTRDEATWLDDEHTRMRLFIAIMFAAFDTTSSGSASMAYLLARHPDWQDRLRDEARGLDERAPSPDALKTLEQQERVWKETLRLYPVAPFLSRVALRDVTLGDLRIPSRTFVNAMTGTASRDPKWWTEPLRFDPDRFSPDRAEDKRHKATYLPFGAGAHTCVGAQLAGVEVKAFWHALLTRCRFRLAKDYVARHTYTPIGIVSGDVELVLEPL